jgi:hypothetical protein
MAKINGKWKAFDSTWGLYFDKFPISHVFGNYYDFSWSSHYSYGISINSAKYDTTFSGFVVENNLRKLEEEAEEALFIREEKIRKKEEDLIKKEKELNITEDELNIRGFSFSSKTTLSILKLLIKLMINYKIIKTYFIKLFPSFCSFCFCRLIIIYSLF